MDIKVDDLIFDTYIDYQQISERVVQLGEQLSSAFSDDIPVFISVLNGSFMFVADLMKEISVPCEVCFLKMQSYTGTESGSINQLIGLNVDLNQRKVIVVEDIVDSGKTLEHTLALLKEENPESISVCTLLYKPKALQVSLEKEIDYVGFKIENDFVVGYGMDYNGLGRNLKDIYRKK